MRSEFLKGHSRLRFDRGLLKQNYIFSPVSHLHPPFAGVTQLMLTDTDGAGIQYDVSVNRHDETSPKQTSMDHQEAGWFSGQSVGPKSQA